MQNEHAELQSETKILDVRLRRVNEEIYRLDCNVTKARELGMTEKTRGEEAFAALPEEYQNKIDSEGKWPQLALSYYPDDDDLQTAARLAQEAVAAQSKLHNLQGQKATRDELRARRAPFENIRQTRESEYTPERETEIRAAHAQAKSDRENAAQQLKNLEAPLQNAASEVEKAQSEIETARENQPKRRNRGRAGKRAARRHRTCPAKRAE